MNNKYKVGEYVNGFLVVGIIKLTKDGKNYKFKCPLCGNIFSSLLWPVKLKKSKSCGCNRGWNFIKHGYTRNRSATPEYNAWCSMKCRCYDVNGKAYHNYGGRGIQVCDRWLNSFENFFEDMGNRPTSKHSLDRYPNNNGNYEPGNCRWATISEQRQNQRDAIIVEYMGVKKPLLEWCKKLNLKYKLMWGRLIRYGKTPSEAFETPIRYNKRSYKFINHTFGYIKT